MKDALTDAGVTPKEEVAAPVKEKSAQKWLKELPEDDRRPHIPFDAPAVLKPKPSKKP